MMLAAMRTMLQHGGGGDNGKRWVRRQTMGRWHSLNKQKLNNMMCSFFHSFVWSCDQHILKSLKYLPVTRTGVLFQRIGELSCCRGVNMKHIKFRSRTKRVLYTTYIVMYAFRSNTELVLVFQSTGTLVLF